MQYQTKCLLKNLTSLNFLTKSSPSLNKFIVPKYFSSEKDSSKKASSPFLKKDQIKTIISENLEVKATKNVFIKDSFNGKTEEKPTKRKNRSKKKDDDLKMEISEIKITEKFVKEIEISKESVKKRIEITEKLVKKIEVSEKEEEAPKVKETPKIKIEEDVFKKIKHPENEKPIHIVIPPKGFISAKGIKAVEISRLQSLENIKDFLRKPTNMVLSLNEKNIIYDKIAKIIWNLGDKFDKNEIDNLLENFFSKFLNAIQASENHKVYLAVLKISIPKVLIPKLEDFYAKCFDDLVFKFPKLKHEEILSIYPIIQRFYSHIEMNPEYERQVEKILSFFEEKMDTLNFQQKNNILRLMRQSGIYNYKILDFMLYYVEMNYLQLSYENMLLIIKTNLNARKITPFELIYKLRNKFNQSYMQLEPLVIVSTLMSFSKMRLFFIEPFYENIFSRLNDSLKKLTIVDCVMILNAYCKIKYRDEIFFEKCLNKIQKNLAPLGRIHTKILILALANINHPNKSIFFELCHHHNILTLIKEIQDDNDVPQFDKDYLQAIYDLIISEFPNPPEVPQENKIQEVRKYEREIDIDAELDAVNLQKC